MNVEIELVNNTQKFSGFSPLIWMQLVVGAFVISLAAGAALVFGKRLCESLSDKYIKRIFSPSITKDDLIAHCQAKQDSCFGKRASDMQAIMSDLTSVKNIMSDMEILAHRNSRAIRIMAIHSVPEADKRIEIEKALDGHDIP